jgi:hypothetical protein
LGWDLYSTFVDEVVVGKVAPFGWVCGTGGAWEFLET